jgi:hypothetical protein
MALTRLPGIVVFTVVETVTLGAWLALVSGMPVDSPLAVVGVIVLFVGLTVEGILTDVTFNGLSLDLPFLGILGFSLAETVIWVVWLGVADRVGGLAGILGAGVLLAVLFVPQHSIEDNVLGRRDALSNLLLGGTVGFSIVEAVGATVWLALVRRGGRVLDALGVDLPALGGSTLAEPAALVGLLALLVVLLVEHLIASGFNRRMQRLA